MHNISLSTQQFCIKFQLTCHNKKYGEKYHHFSSRSEAKYYLHLQKYSAFQSDHNDRTTQPDRTFGVARTMPNCFKWWRHFKPEVLNIQTKILFEV